MNRKGFTLVELLATIALIAVLMLLFMPTIGNLVSEFQNKDKVEMLKNSAIMSAKEYVTDGYGISDIDCTSDPKVETVMIEIQDLINDKYLDALFTEYYDKDNNIKIGNKVEVTYSCDAKKFTDYEVVFDES